MLLVKTVDKINSIVKWFIVAALMGTVAVIGVSIVCRDILHVAFPYSEEIAKYLTVFVVYCASAMSARNGGLTRLTFIVDLLHLKEKGTKVIEWIIGFISIAFYVLVSYSTVKLIPMVQKSRQLSPALKMPMWIPYVSMIIGCVLLVINTLAHMMSLNKNNDSIEGSEAE